MSSFLRTINNRTFVPSVLTPFSTNPKCRCFYKKDTAKYASSTPRRRYLPDDRRSRAKNHWKPDACYFPTRLYQRGHRRRRGRLLGGLPVSCLDTASSIRCGKFAAAHNQRQWAESARGRDEAGDARMDAAP